MWAYVPAMYVSGNSAYRKCNNPPRERQLGVVVGREIEVGIQSAGPNIFSFEAIQQSPPALLGLELCLAPPADRPLHRPAQLLQGL